MTRRKVFIAFAAAVMILVLTAALFVACDQTKTYTVTFKDGDTVVKTVSVKDGATIADADLPADPAKDGAVFEGWFDGDKAFDKTAAITSDATYLAKWTGLVTVTFKTVMKSSRQPPSKQERRSQMQIFLQIPKMKNLHLSVGLLAMQHTIAVRQ